MEINLTSKCIASFLGRELNGENHLVTSFSSITNLKHYALAFTNSKTFKSEFPITLITNSRFKKICDHISTIVVDDPKLSFVKILDEFYPNNATDSLSNVHKISDEALIGRNVKIGNYSTIMNDVEIGQNTQIGNNVIIHSGTQIGSNCIISCNTVIGHCGFGFAFDNGIPKRFKHIGNTKIGNYVEIGSNCTIARAALDSTIIHDHVKIDDHVHIAHNCKVGDNTIITAGAILSGSVEVEPDCWIGPNATIIQKSKIGKSSLIGIRFADQF